MKIILGSASEQKVKIITQAIEGTEIIPVSIESGVTDQPLDEDVTIRGSINRAQNAIVAYGKNDFDFSIGLEGGLAYVNGLFNLICVVSIVDYEGRVHVGVSRKLPLPRQVSLAVENGEQFGEAIRAYEQTIKNKNLPKLIRHIEELIGRETSFTEAALSAYLQLEFINEAYK